MGITQAKFHKRKSTGGRFNKWRKKRKFELGRPAAMTKIGGARVRPVRCRGGNIKMRALRLDTGNFSWPSERCTRKAKILDVVYNASNNELVRTKTIMKNCIVKIDASAFKSWYQERYGVGSGEGKEFVELAELTENIMKKVKAEKKQKTEKKNRTEQKDKTDKKEKTDKKDKSEKKDKTDKKDKSEKKEKTEKKDKSDKKSGEKGKEDAIAPPPPKKKKIEPQVVLIPKIDPVLRDMMKQGYAYACISSRPGQVGRADGYLLEGKELDFYKKKMDKKKQK